MSFLFLIFMIAISYCSGSLCSAIIVSRFFDLPDPRTQGSKNPGATNILRIAGKKYAIIVLIVDMLKGLLPVAIAHLFHASNTELGFICLAAVIGHMYPVFFGFNGGKGVATALGGLVGLQFLLGMSCIGIWLFIAWAIKYSSLASIITLILAPILSIIYTGNVHAFIPLLFITVLILYKHRKNINRLMDGTEPKIYFTKHNISDITNEIIEDNIILEEEEKEPIIKKNSSDT